MSEEATLMTDPAATTTEGDPASQPTEAPDATGAQDHGQQQQQQSQAPKPDETGQQPSEGKEEAKPKEEPKKAEGAPEQYEFKAPEGQEFDDAIIGPFSEVAKELNLTQDAAQKILDKMGPVMAERQAEQVAQVQAQWKEQAVNDKEFGGDKLPENLGLAKKAMDQFATPELSKLLGETGMGNHPEVVRLFVRVGKAISEDGFVAGTAAPARSEKSFYPNSNMN